MPSSWVLVHRVDRARASFLTDDGSFDSESFGASLVRSRINTAAVLSTARVLPAFIIGGIAFRYMPQLIEIASDVQAQVKVRDVAGRGARASKLWRQPQAFCARATRAHVHFAQSTAGARPLHSLSRGLARALGDAGRAPCWQLNWQYNPLSCLLPLPVLGYIAAVTNAKSRRSSRNSSQRDLNYQERAILERDVYYRKRMRLKKVSTPPNADRHTRWPQRARRRAALRRLACDVTHELVRLARAERRSGRDGYATL